MLLNEALIRHIELLDADLKDKLRYPFAYDAALVRRCTNAIALVRSLLMACAGGEPAGDGVLDQIKRISKDAAIDAYYTQHTGDCYLPRVLDGIEDREGVWHLFDHAGEDVAFVVASMDGRPWCSYLLNELFQTIELFAAHNHES